MHYFVTTPDEREAYVKEIRPLAKKYKEYLHFVTTDAHEYADAAEMMGSKGGERGLSVQQTSNGAVYPFRGSQTLRADIVEGFLTDIIQGKVQPWSPQDPAGKGGQGHDEL